VCVTLATLRMPGGSRGRRRSRSPRHGGPAAAPPRWSVHTVLLIEPLRRRYQPVADRLLESVGPAATAALRAEGIALMAEGAAMSPAELAAIAAPGGG
jgi:hypothetical protein